MNDMELSVKLVYSFHKHFTENLLYHYILFYHNINHIYYEYFIHIRLGQSSIFSIANTLYDRAVGGQQKQGTLTTNQNVA